MRAQNDTDPVLRALRMAITRRRRPGALIFHSDRGSTYAATDFTAELRQYGIEPSMSRKGDCWDNAVVESFCSSLKTAWLREEGYDTISNAMAEVFNYIEMFYNPRRMHPHLGYESPDSIEGVRGD